MLKGGLESAAMADWRVLLKDGTVSEARARPVVAWSTFAGTLSNSLPILQAGLKSKILGDGLLHFTTELSKIQPALALLNTYGDPALLRTTTSLSTAVAEAIAFLKTMEGMAPWSHFTMELLRQGLNLIHTSYQMIEWGGVLSDLKGFAKEIVHLSDQPCAPLLKAFVDSSGSQKAKRQAFQAFLAEGLALRAGKTPAPEDPQEFDFSQMGGAAPEAAEEEDNEEPQAAPPRRRQRRE